ncbi:hypothetical protein GJAV_G00093870 [Gymnothorax javanicus]|nr:hypothetical protein GJAV_G00093870 [Gymnothorax javanicus]
MVYEWIDDQRKCLIPVSKNMICVKAIEVARDLGEANFSGCASWCDRFMKRKGLSVCRSSHISQKIPRDYEEQVMAFHRFIVKMRRKNTYELGQIGVMHEVPMCFDLPPNRTVTKTGEKAVQVKTSGQEKSYSTVVLSCCADGTKLQPLVILKRKMLPKERIPAGVAVQVHEMGWMEERSMIEWIKIVWDRRPDVVIIPDRLTGILQPLDVAVNKLFKDRMRQKWVDWLSGDHSFTAQGNLKRPQLATVCEWIKESWEEIPMDLIKRAFLKTSISNWLDGTEDDALFNSGPGTGTDSDSEDSVLERVIEQKWSFKPGEKEEPTGVEEVESHLQLSIMGNQFKNELEEDLCDSVHHSASTVAEPVTQPTAVKAEKKADTESTPVGDSKELREPHRCGHGDEGLSGLGFVVKAEQEEEHVAQRLNQRNSDIKCDDPVCSNATEQCSQSQSIQSPQYHTPATMEVSRSTLPSSEASYAEEFDKMDEKPSVCSEELRSEAVRTQQGQYRERLVHTVERENQTLLPQQQQQRHGPSVKHRRGSESPAQPHSGSQYETGSSLNSAAVKAGKKRKTRRRPGFSEKLFSCTQFQRNAKSEPISALT